MSKKKPEAKKTETKKNQKKAPRENETFIRREVRPLPVVLKPEELAERAQSLADCETRQREHDAHTESVKKELKAKETAISAERSRLAGIVKAKAEPREVEVDVLHLSKEREYREVRKDTGEVIFHRPLNAQELQRDLDLGDEVLAAPRQHDPGKLANGPGGLRDATNDGKKAPPSTFPSDS